jgi:hypothetical protein
MKSRAGACMETASYKKPLWEVENKIYMNVCITDKN